MNERTSERVEKKGGVQVVLTERRIELELTGEDASVEKAVSAGLGEERPRAAPQAMKPEIP